MDVPGYITEKIFDSFFSGCIPVYWGANNIETYIPENCFIDKRKFLSYEDLYSYMKEMSDEEYIGYINNIQAFLKSDLSSPFKAETFAEKVVSEVLN